MHFMSTSLRLGEKWILYIIYYIYYDHYRDLGNIFCVCYTETNFVWKLDIPIALECSLKPRSIVFVLWVNLNRKIKITIFSFS